MIRVTNSGNFKNTERLLKNIAYSDPTPILNRYGELGVSALSAATPIDSGETSASWSYKVKKTKKGYSLEWYNSHMAGEIPVVVLLQYGHATKNGGYVEGIDFINPALKDTFNGMAYDLWKEIVR